MLLAGFCAVISGLCGAALIKIVTDYVNRTGNTTNLAVTFFGLCIAILFTRSAAQLSILSMSQKAIMEMRVTLSKKMIGNSHQKLQHLGKHRLLVILTEDIASFTSALQIAPQILTQGIVTIACFSYLGYLSPVLLIMLTITLVICLVFFHLAQRYPLNQLRIIREKTDTLYKNLRDLIDGSRELQLNNRRGDNFINNVIAKNAKEFREIFFRGSSSMIIVTNVGDVLFYIVIGIVIFIVPNFLHQKSEVWTSVSLVLLYLIGPISIMINSVPALNRAGISLRRIQQLDFDLTKEVRIHKELDPFLKKVDVLIELQNVTHHYHGKTDDAPFLLGPINLQITSGETLFIVGGNGSGKTTLAMLLIGLYLPESGTSFMNEHAVTEENVAYYRQNFSAIFSDFHLFEELLCENLEEILTKATSYLKKLEIDHKVKIIDGKFSTIDLSAGQRKRLALITAYLEDKPIYLFDEWAADQDPAFKRIFYAELLPDLKRRGKTIIVITHDDAYFNFADRVIRLKEGNIESITQYEERDKR